MLYYKYYYSLVYSTLVFENNFNMMLLCYLWTELSLIILATINLRQHNTQKIIQKW